MKHLAKRLLSARRTLLGGGLALALAVFATTAPASAQRLNTHKGGTQWEVGIGKAVRSGGAALRIGSRGVSLDLYSRGRRGYSGGHYEYRNQRTWIPGHSRQVWVEPVYDWRHDASGRRHQVLIQAGYYHTVAGQGRYENRQVQVWVPARGIQTRGHDRSRRRRSSRSHRVTYRH